MTTCCTSRYPERRPLRKTHKLATKIDLEFTAEHPADMALIAPVRLDKFRGQFQQTYLFITGPTHLEARTVNPLLPFQFVKQDTVLLHLFSQFFHPQFRHFARHDTQLFDLGDRCVDLFLAGLVGQHDQVGL